MQLAKPNSAAVLLSSLCLVACHSKREDLNVQPSFVRGALRTTTYDGASNDLLTGGLGKGGLAIAAPAFASPASPTPAELRVRAIYNNYRALVDMTPGGGYGVLYGPNIDAQGADTLGEGKIAGDEIIAYLDDGTGQQNVTLMVQLPKSFDPTNACIITGTSSGSRGVYGAIATAGEWGLKHRCAVAYTDKGTGNGVHDLQANTVSLIDGARADAAAAGADSAFTAQVKDADRAAFNAQFPNRFAVKHAHSMQNPEKDWGTYTLQAVQLAFFVLNERFAALAKDGTHHLRLLTPGNTIVIASSVSNGGGASLAAAELDTDGLIGGVVVGEPQVQVAANAAVIKRGGAAVGTSGSSLFEYVTLANLYQPCASQAAGNAGIVGLSLLDPVRAAARCTALAAKGLVTGADTAARAADAQARLLAAGWEPESNVLQASHYQFATLAIAVTYANTYGKFSVTDNLCGYSFGATDSTGAPAALAPAALAGIFASGNGIPPTGGINVINNLSVGGPRQDDLSTSASTGARDYDVDGALCLRSLATGTDPATGAALTGAALDNSRRVRAGIAAVLRNGNLRGKPALLVQGRADTLVPINHASRAYLAANKLAEGSTSTVSLIEVANAQHFDTFIGALPAYASRLVPLHRYLVQGLDLMYAHLKSGAPLPPSQVVRTVPRGGPGTAGTAPAITLTNVPPISQTPAASDSITFSAGTLTVPD